MSTEKTFTTLQAKAALQGYVCPASSGPLVYLLEQEAIAASGGLIVRRYGTYHAFNTIHEAWLDQQALEAQP